MHAQTIEHILHNVTYKKTIDEIKEKVSAKITEVKAKIETRIGRVEALRKEHEIDDKALIQLLTEAREQQNGRSAEKMSYSYSVSNTNGPSGEKAMEERVIGAGVVNHLLTENDFIQAEKSAVARLELLNRNIRPYTEHDHNGVPYTVNEFSVSEADLKYLGF